MQKTPFSPYPQPLWQRPAPPLLPASLPPKWMWVAIGGLGACVVALATVLVVERRSAPPTEAAMAQTTPAALAAPAVASSLQAAPGLRPLLASAAPQRGAAPSPPGRKPRSPW